MKILNTFILILQQTAKSEISLTALTFDSVEKELKRVSS